MPAEQESTFTINGIAYNAKQLSPEGHQLLALINEAQNELSRLDVQRKLLQASQQHLLGLLTPLLPTPTRSSTDTARNVLGQASGIIPTTPVTPPEEQPAPFPENLPDMFRAQP